MNDMFATVPIQIAAQMALRDALREDGLRCEPVSVADELPGKDGMR